MTWTLRLTAVLLAAQLATPAVALQIGDRAPDFSAASTSGEITLSQVLAKGPVVLAFYYNDFTSG
jgi:peroxiredoxin